VVLNAPAVFKWTASSDPERHLTAARIMGADTTNSKDSDAGEILSHEIVKLMKAMNIGDCCEYIMRSTQVRISSIFFQ